MIDPHRSVPVDPDVEPGEHHARARQVHLSLSNIGLVAAGGAAGTGLRYLISMLVPTWVGVPVATVAINVAGALLLGLLLELLAHHSPDIGWSHRLRLGLGTGFLGGFTTYSALGTDTATLATGRPGLAAAYALGTVVLGATAGTAGIWLSRRHLGPASSTWATPP